MRPLVSVIIPTYNRANYLKKAIESVLAQTYKNIEVIVVDDGSTDNTKEIVRSFNDPRVIYIFQQNKGAAWARNKGIEKAQGKYIAFLDSDDLWLSEKLEKQIEFIEKNPEIGILGTGCYQINKKGEIVGKKIFPRDNQTLQKILIKYNPFIQSSIIIKKEAIEKVGKYNPGFLESEDYELWLRIAKEYKIANLVRPLVIKTYHEQSLSPAKDKKQLIYALRAKREAIKRGQYSQWYWVYFLISYLFMRIPFFLRKIIRRYLLGKRYY